MSQSTRDAIESAFHEITSRFVRYTDVRPQNILHVSKETALPSLPMPISKTLSKWRIVDLGTCQLHCLDIEHHREKHDVPALNVLFGDLVNEALKLKA